MFERLADLRAYDRWMHRTGLFRRCCVTSRDGPVQLGTSTRAREAARVAGYRGAMYPWQSGSDGQEEAPTTHLDPLSKKWEPDLSHNQRHVSAAIFYAAWQFHLATNDRLGPGQAVPATGRPPLNRPRRGRLDGAWQLVSIHG